MERQEQVVEDPAEKYIRVEAEHAGYDHHGPTDTWRQTEFVKWEEVQNRPSISHLVSPMCRHHSYNR